MQWVKVLLGVLGAAAFLGVGIILGHYVVPKGDSSPPKETVSLSQDLDFQVLEMVMAQLDAMRIRDNLRELSREPHLATTPQDEKLVQLLLQRWRDPESGLDAAEAPQYEVLLSFPREGQPNTVTVVDPAGKTLFSCRQKEKNLTGEQEDPNVVPPYAAYGPGGNVEGFLVYANRGTDEDFKVLRDRGLDLRNTIALTRYGGAGRGEKAINAFKYGVAGVLVYTDPADINDGWSQENETFPHSWYMPPSGVERGSFSENFGDPLTPYLPATPSSFRLDLGSVPGLPPIPIQPISFEDAKMLLCNLQGGPAPDSWQGALGCEYKLGPGFMYGNFSEDSKVNMSIHNYVELRNSSNVLGIIRGAVEPDRYVIYGNHRDSWVHGAVDPSSGTAVLLELTRVLGTLLKKGTWRPRRSIVFASWGAEEFGLIGSTEFTEEFFNKLQERTVAYINVDIAVFANATLRAQGTPPVQSVIFSAARQIQAPGTSLSVYDNWIQYFNRSSPVHGVIPNLGSLGAGSDYASFIHFLGISSMDIAYTYDRSKTSARIYPTYHTAFDTFGYVDQFVDPGFSSHQTVARVAGNVLLRLSDSLFLPLNVKDYSETLRSFYDTVKNEVGAVLAQKKINLGPLGSAVEKFEKAAETLIQRQSELQNNPEPLQVRMLNDQLMLLERTFLNPRAFPEKLYYSHVLWAPRTGSVPTFPGLSNAYSNALGTTDGSPQWAEVQRQLSIVVAALEGAAAMMRPVADL